VLTTIAGIVETNVVISASGDNASATVVTSAWLIFMLPHSIVAVSIATAYFTRMSEHAATNSLPEVRADLSTSLRIITVLMVLAAAMLAVFAYPFSGIFTNFNFPDSVAMGNVVIAFLVGLPAFSVLFVLQRAFYALGDTRTPFFITLFQVIIFIIGAVVMLSVVPKENLAVGVALTLSGSTILQALLAAILIRRRLGGVGGRTIVSSLGKDATAVVPALAAGLTAAFYLGFFDLQGFANSGYIPAILGMSAVAVVMGSVYVGLLRLIRSRELDTAVTALSKRLPRG
jgi:putative peptidoglycan lipid II flippase